MYASDYSLAELMCVVAAKELAGAKSILLGLGLPVLIGTFAKIAYFPEMQVMTEVGVFDWCPDPESLPRAPVGISDMPLNHGSAMLSDMLDALGCALMGGNLDTVFLGAAQIDKYGNLNTLVVGDYANPVKRLGGTGGNTDAACLAKKVITVMPHERRRYVERVDFLTSPGYIDGPGGRDKHGLDPQGPNAVVSTLGVLRFDTPDGGRSGSCEMYLDAVFPNVTADVVKSQTGWDLKVAPRVREVEPPTGDELALLRRLDPLKRYLAAGRY